MTIEEVLNNLETRAVSCMQNFDPKSASFHDYRELVNQVDKVMRAINAAHIAANKADQYLYEREQQR